MLAELDLDLSLDDRLRVEALLREIDASFASETAPEHLVTARSALVARLGPLEDSSIQS